jgi:phosphohistidine phosphatase
VKRLTLMRHADAQWKDPEVDDFARPLNRRGTNEAEAIARRLQELTLVPDLIMTSPARRAAQTAEIITRELTLLPRTIRYEEPLYLAGAQEILKLVRDIGPRVAHLLLIGHNPGISEAAHILSPRSEMEGLATGGLCTMTFDIEQWTAIAPGLVQSSSYETPPTTLFSSLFA